VVYPVGSCCCSPTPDLLVDLRHVAQYDRAVVVQLAWLDFAEENNVGRLIEFGCHHVLVGKRGRDGKVQSSPKVSDSRGLIAHFRLDGKFPTCWEHYRWNTPGDEDPSQHSDNTVTKPIMRSPEGTVLKLKSHASPDVP